MSALLRQLLLRNVGCSLCGAQPLLEIMNPQL